MKDFLEYAFAVGLLTALWLAIFYFALILCALWKDFRGNR